MATTHQIIHNFFSKKLVDKIEINHFENHILNNINYVDINHFISSIKLGPGFQCISNFSSDGFLKEFLFEKIILKNNFSDDTLELLGHAVLVNCLPVEWIKKIKNSVGKDSLIRFVAVLKKNILSFDMLEKVSTHISELNPFEVVNYNSIETPLFGHVIGFNLFHLNRKDIRKDRYKKNELLSYLTAKAPQWQHLIQNKQLITRMLFPLLPYRHNVDRLHIRNFLQLHDIKLDLKTQACYSNNLKNIFFMHELLFRNGIFDYLSKEEQKELTIKDYMFKNVRQKTYESTKSTFLRLLKKEQDFFSDQNMNSVLDQMCLSPRFYFPITKNMLLKTATGFDINKVPQKNPLNFLNESNKSIDDYSRRLFLDLFYEMNPNGFNNISTRVIFNITIHHLKTHFNPYSGIAINPILKLYNNLNSDKKTETFNLLIEFLSKEAVFDQPLCTNAINLLNVLKVNLNQTGVNTTNLKNYIHEHFKNITTAHEEQLLSVLSEIMLQIEVPQKNTQIKLPIKL